MVKSSEKGSLLVLVAFAVLLGVQLKPAVAGVDGRYRAMQTEVRKIVQGSIHDAPGLIRLVFHDCWVKGCDASVLLNTNGKNEIHAPQNGGLRGMAVIQAIKDKLAPYKASCADAVVFAAREATVLLSNNKITYDVDGPGRKDASTSAASDAGVLPGPQSSFDQLVDNFRSKNFSPEELVVLSGAHAIRQAHRPTLEARLHRSVSDRGEINEEYQSKVDEKSKPDPQAVANNVRDMLGGFDAVFIGYQPADLTSLFSTGVLDNSYYTANLQNMVLFNSDWTLRTDDTAAAAMELYRDDAQEWYALFGKAMAKLSKLSSKGPFVKDGVREFCDKII